MPITHGSNCAIVFINCARRTSRRSTTFPARSTPCNWNRFFAKSTPKVVILFTDPSPLWHESIRHTFILAHYVTPLKWGWVHSISLGRLATVARPPTANEYSRPLPDVHERQLWGVLPDDLEGMS